ncbi:MAG: rod shape-determining protein MreC [Fusobacteriaceae bacterium]
MLSKFKKGSNRKLLILVLVVLLLLSLKQKISYFGNFVDRVLYPFQSRIFLLEDGLHRIYSEIKSYPKTVEKIKNLKRENTLLSIENLRNRSLKEENERLKELLEMKSSNSHIKIATVGFRSINDLNDNFHINLGSEDGINENMYAVYENNLIGRVIEVYRNHSKVRMITSNKLRISAVTKENMLGVISGDEGENGNLVFKSTLIKNVVKIGDAIFTSGISDIYSEGIKIGTVIEKGQEQGEYIVDPKMDIIKLREVVLIEKE